MHTQDEIDPVLVERFAHGNGTVFVGAGISLGSRLPSWHTLMEPLRSDLGRDISSRASYLDIAELYEIKHSRSVLVQYVKERLGDVRFQLTKAHELIVRLPVQRIYTTNFDNLLEQASQKKQINRNVIFNASHVGFSDTSTLSIVKLHGDLSDPESIVISARDFYSYFARHPAVADLLKVELQTHTVLFLGYSFSDPNLGMVLGNVSTQSGAVRPLLYSLQFQPNDLTRRAMSARGVKVIALDAKPGTPEADRAVEDWLRRFHQSLVTFERRTRSSPVQATHARESSMPVSRKHCVRRTRILDRIKAGLHSDFRVVVVKGEPGVGKTQLVAEAAADCLHPPGANMLDEAFERVIWIRGLPNAVEPRHTLSHILETIAGQVDTQLSGVASADLGTKQSQINMVLQERRLLIVIEDLDDPSSGLKEQERAQHNETCKLTKVRHCQFKAIREWLENPGLYANPKSRIVVTSRNAIVAGFVVEVAKMDNDEARELLSEHARTLVLAKDCTLDAASKETLVRLAAGNPQALKWLLGLCKVIRGERQDPADERLAAWDKELKGKTIELVFDKLVEMIMGELKEEEKSALHAMMVFPSEQWVPARLVEAAVSGMPRDCQPQNPLRQHMITCVQCGLLEHDPCKDLYLMHRTAKEVLLRKTTTSEQLDSARKQLATYLLNLLKEVIRSPHITDEYWDALVKDEMAKIDTYWPTIEYVMHWAGQRRDSGAGASAYPRIGNERPLVVQFALLLVHYMDSRFLNAQRLKFIRLALKALGSAEARTSALLRIDALGWTFIEENKCAKARMQIQLGMDLLKDEPAPDLKALGNAWRARIDASEGKNGEAHKHIAEAWLQANKCPEKHWIWARVAMIAGDVELMGGNAHAAVVQFRESARYADMYGGEGDGYQINPRIGLALMATLEGNPDGGNETIEQARRRFTRLAENEHLATGRLYGKYGLALIAARERTSREAIHQLEHIMREIRRRSTGHVLLGLAEKSYKQLLSAGHGD